MRIEVTSTLTQDDENRLAAAIAKTLAGMLDMLPIAYIVRVETTDAHTVEAVSPLLSAWDPAQGSTENTGRPVVES